MLRVLDRAAATIDDLYRYAVEHWGVNQADHYLRGLFDAFEGIETGATVSRPIPAAFGVNGFYFRYQRHIVYWKRLGNDDIGIAAILHERMHQSARLKEEFEF